MDCHYSNADSNAIILPPKTKTSKGKPKSQINNCQNKHLSKSQKRKLKKLEEEKEKQVLLSKSLEILDKYKISDDSYLLLHSSEKIGQAETMREKRRRVMQLSKAGLDVPPSDMSSKKKKVGLCESKYDSVEDRNVSVFIKGEIISDSSCVGYSEGTDGQNRRGSIGENDSKELIKEVGGAEKSCKLINLDAQTSSLSPDNDKNTTASMGEPNGESIDITYVTKNLGDDANARSYSAPTVVHVSRPTDVENARADLPIIMMEQEIMETINNHSCIIISGETGCGKTTQIPQFLYEAGYGSASDPIKGGIIGITQPRRVAVLSTAKRVAYELGLRLGKEVGFQVRHDRKIGENCSIKFMTDGILLRELQSDFYLRRYSVIILDEAHERSLNTDILIGMLSHTIRERQIKYEEQQKLLARKEIFISPKDKINPLKLILMSATLRIEDFTSGGRIFPKIPPVIHIPTRQYPVKTHFAKKTVLKDYISAAYKKVLKIHKNLPSGGILVFVTGQREVESLCRMLRQASKQFVNRRSKVCAQAESTLNGMSQIDGHSMDEIDEALDTSASLTEQQLGRFSCYDESDNDDACSSSSLGSDNNSDIESDSEDLEDQRISSENDCMGDISKDVNLDTLKLAFEALTEKTALISESSLKEANFASQDVCYSLPLSSTKKKGENKAAVVGPMRVLPLYAMLPASAQLHVFEEIKDGDRVVVVATNVAETSLTIPGIRYVVDTGREKVKEYNPSNGMESYKIQWISKASAAQRAGRAGRTGPGHCYCLYSSAALSNQFAEFSCPEILKVPVDDVVLVMKSMGISKVANFPFPTPPDATELIRAERRLMALEALDSKGRITPLGKTMALYPMSPRHSRLLLAAIKITKIAFNVRPNLVLGYAVAIAAALSSSNPFLFHFVGSHTNPEAAESGDYPASFDKQAKLMRKQMKESSRLSRAKFSNLKSDAITVAYALQCFELANNPPQFCEENNLHLKVMVEMSKLRKQLLNLVFNQRYSESNKEYTWTYGSMKDVEDCWGEFSEKNPLWEKEEDILCQAICAGWADRVAKRIRGASVLLSEEDRRVSAIRYQACSVEETVFLHHRSSVSKAAPDILVYNELLRTKRAYIHGATSVKSEWLVEHAGSLCTYSAPVTDPKPIYDPHYDQVFCYAIPYFGPHLWELPVSKVPINDVQQRITVFAFALLDGQVLPCLNSVKSFMACQPSSILKPEALGQKRVGNLLSKLTRSRTIDSCCKLNEVWKENPQFLHSEILDWFQHRFHRDFEVLWEKMHEEARLAPQKRFPERSNKRNCSVK